jgi:lysophospholipase
VLGGQWRVAGDEQAVPTGKKCYSHLNLNPWKDSVIIKNDTKIGGNNIGKSLSQSLPDFWCQNFKEENFLGFQGVRLRYVHSHNSTDAVNGVVLLGGRTEFAEKYVELFHDLYDLNVDFYSYDHRGQGMSERLLPDPHKGHVDNFDDYVEDLKIFCDDIVARRHSNVFVLAHSMGGAITALFQRKYPGVLGGAILCSPMFEIDTSPIPSLLARWLARGAVGLGYGNNYIIRGGPYRGTMPFAGNPLTSSRKRFANSLALVEENPQLALGSPTNNWLWQAFRAAENIVASQVTSDLPILLLQGGSDPVVTAAGHEQFCRHNSSCRLHTIEGGRHELLMEQDALRSRAIDRITDFLVEQGVRHNNNKGKKSE